MIQVYNYKNPDTKWYKNYRSDFVTRANKVLLQLWVLLEVNHVSKSCCTLLHVLCFIFDLIFSYFYLNSQQPNALGFSYASNVRFYGNSYLSNTNSLSPLSLFVMSKLVTVHWFSVEIGLLQYLMKILYDGDNFRIW